MKATFNIYDDLVRELQEEADRRGATTDALVEAALGRFLQDCKQFRKDHEAALEATKSKPLPPLPKAKMRKPLVDYADRKTLERVMALADSMSPLPTRDLGKPLIDYTSREAIYGLPNEEDE